MLDYRVLPAGDTALVVDFGDRIDRELNAAVLSLARGLEAERIEGVIETVPTLRSLMVHYEPLAISAAALTAHIDEQMRKLKLGEIAGRLWYLPVCYDPGFAIDLDEVAQRTALSCEQVVECHTSPVYRVYMLGFLPGQAYLGEIPAQLSLQRRETPRPRIAAGSVAIAGRMSCVFPLETPCGWHVIGRCPIPLWDAARASALLAPADTVAFVPISVREYETLAARASQGALRLKPATEPTGAAA
jgi:inhibitor of KinA